MKSVLIFLLVITGLLAWPTHSNIAPLLMFLLDDEEEIDPIEEVENVALTVGISRDTNGLTVLSDAAIVLDQKITNTVSVQTNVESNVILTDEKEALFGLSISTGGANQVGITSISTALALIYNVPFDWQSQGLGFATFRDRAVIHEKFPTLVTQVENLQSASRDILSDTGDSFWALIAEIALDISQATKTKSAQKAGSNIFSGPRHPTVQDADERNGFGIKITNGLFAPYGIAAFDADRREHIRSGLRGPYWASGVDGIINQDETTTEFNQLGRGNSVLCLAKKSNFPLPGLPVQNLVRNLRDFYSYSQLIDGINDSNLSEIEKTKITASFKGDIAFQANLGIRLLGLWPIKGDIAAPVLSSILETINRDEGFTLTEFSKQTTERLISIDTVERAVGVAVDYFSNSEKIRKSKSFARYIVGKRFPSKNGGEQNAILKKLKIKAQMLGRLLFVVDLAEILSLAASIELNDDEKCFLIEHDSSGVAFIQDYTPELPQNSIEGQWSGSYEWTCAGGGSSHLNLEITYNRSLQTYEGTATYLMGSTQTSSIIFNCEDPNSTLCSPDTRDGSPLSFEVVETSNNVYNQFSGVFSRVMGDELAITGTTVNGDSGFNGNNGCSEGVGPSGSFQLTKVEDLAP